MPALGCPTVNILVAPRGGASEIPVTVGTARTWSSVEFHRLSDDSSGAQIRIEGRAQCCDWASKVRPWEHELVVYWGDERAWSGPVTEVDWVEDELRIGCKDRMEWMRHRKIHNNHEYGAGIDLSTIFRDLVVDGLSIDTSPNITLAVQLCGVTVGAAEGRKYLAGQTKYVNDAINELARTGVDWTCVDFTCYVGGPGAFSPTILRPSHFENEPEATIDGNEFGTRFYVVGAGRGEDADTIVGTNIVDPALEAQYGIHERISSEAEIRDQLSANAAAQTRFDLFGRTGPPFYLPGGKLIASAPVSINDLIPGRIFRVQAEDPCKPIPGFMRLASVTGSVGPEHQYIEVEFEPLGTEA